MEKYPENIWDVPAFYINLDKRTDRRAKMEVELARVGICGERVRATPTSEYTGSREAFAKMIELQEDGRGQSLVGCHLSHITLMEKLQKSCDGGMALIMEDDLEFCDDLKERHAIIREFLEGKRWHFFWLGGTYHREHYWHGHDHYKMPECQCKVGVDWEKTDNPRIVRAYGLWCSYAYFVNLETIGESLELLKKNAPISKGMDWLFIFVEPLLQTYAFDPGCVIQTNDVSDIRPGVQMFSNFSRLGPHWFQRKIT